MNHEKFLISLAESLNVSLIYRDDPDLIFIRLDYQLSPQPIDTRKDFCKQLSGFEPGDKIIDKSKNNANKYPDIVIGIGYSTSPADANQEVL